MKHKIFIVFIALVASVGTMFAESGTCGDNLTWDLTDGILTFSGSGDMTNWSSSSKVPWYSYRANITSVTIPNSVTSIGSSAFSGCTGLLSITIPNSVTSIGDNAFAQCIGLTSVAIPESVENTGSNPFYGCDSLRSVNWNAINCTTYYDGQYIYPPFQDCKNITSFIIGERVKILPRGLCYGLPITSINIPNGVTSIGVAAFKGCSDLTSVIIPNSVTSIGGAAFAQCIGLTSVTIPNSVTSIGDDAFYGCSGLTSPVYNAHIFAYMPPSYSGSYAIPSGIETIAGYAFDGCSGLTSVTIPNSVTSIEVGAFWGCSGLTSITIPNSVTSIGVGAFWECSGLTSVTIPNSVTSIGDYAFYGCSGLISIVWNAKNCQDFTSYKNTPFYVEDIYDIRDRITSFVFGEEVEHIPAYLCAGMTNLTSIEIPNSVTSIGDDAFYGCSSLTNVTIGNSVTSIGDYTFENCSSLTSITIPNSVTSLGEYAFHNCSSLTNVTIGNSVTSIGDYTFENCSSLTNVTIGNSVKSIGDYVFRGCKNLTSVVWNAKNCQDFTSYKNTPFYHYIKYDDDSNNYDLRNQIILFVFGEEVEHIPAYLCDGMTNLTSIEIPNSVTSIGDDAFYGCSGLTSGTIPNSVISIGKYAFYNCSSLTNVTIGNSVTSIGDDAFYGCYSLKSVTIGNSVTSIGDYAFNGCSSIDTVVWNAISCEDMEYSPFYYSRENIKAFILADNIERIPANLCWGVKAISELTIPSSVNYIGKEAFKGCSNLATLSLGQNITTYGENVFAGCANLTSIYNYRERPARLGTDAFDGVDYFNCTLYVPVNSVDMYKAEGSDWKVFYYILPIGTSTITLETREVVVEAGDNVAIFTWPTESTATSYTLQISKDGVFFCTLTFNKSGYLTMLSFAPGRDGQSHAPAATLSVAGMSFTVTGLDGASKYAYNLSVADENNEELVYYQGEFATTGYEGEVVPGGEPVTPGGGTTAIDNVNSSTQSVGTTKFLRNGQLFIQRGDELFNAQGARVR